MKNINVLKTLIPLFIFLGIAVFLGIGLTKDPRIVPSPFIGKPAPQFSLSSLDGRSIVTQNVFIAPNKSVKLLNVWASWCPECWREHDFLMKLQESGMQIVGLNYKDTNEKANAMLTKAGNPFSVIASDLDGRVGIDLGVYGAPETFVINNEGTILYKHVGGLNPSVWNNKIYPIIEGYINENI